MSWIQTSYEQSEIFVEPDGFFSNPIKPGNSTAYRAFSTFQTKNSCWQQQQQQQQHNREKIVAMVEEYETKWDGEDFNNNNNTKIQP